MTDIFNIDKSGVITADTSDLLRDIQTVYTTALGNELNLNADTPQGQLITNDTTILTGCEDKLLQIINDYSVYTAAGPALDVAGSIFGYYRKIKQPTVVNDVILRGTENTLIPAGRIVSDATNEYRLLNNVILNNSGEGVGSFECLKTGNIPCLANTLNTIVTNVDGWDKVNNPYSGINGYDEETDNTFRQRITANWLNIRAKGLLQAIIDNIAQINGVVSVKANENQLNITQTIDGVTMTGHSIYLCILGGADEAVAKVLYEKKTLGCDTIGNVIISYRADDYEYNYKIFRPTNTPIQVQISYCRNINTTIDIQEVLKLTLQDYIINNPFKIGQQIGGNFLANAFDDSNLCDILAVQLNLKGETIYLNYLQLNNLQVATLADIDINFNVVS